MSQDKLMENVQVILELYKKGELNNDQAFDILYGMYRTAKYDPSNKSTDVNSPIIRTYFAPENVTTTWNESISPEQE